jgi:hypothetical protein
MQGAGMWAGYAEGAGRAPDVTVGMHSTLACVRTVAAGSDILIARRGGFGCALRLFATLVELPLELLLAQSVAEGGMTRRNVH